MAVADDLRRTVTALATPEGRLVGTPGHDRARDYLLERLAGAGLEPYADGSYALPYRSAGVGFTNLVAVAPGERRDLAPVLLGAHYDTAGALPGADDNAAAVAIALRVAQRLRERPAARDVVVALFDAEEPPYFHSPAMGSNRFYRHQRRGPIHAAVILDLVGHDVPLPGLEDLLFVTGMESDPDLEKTILALPERPGVRLMTALNRYVGDMSDHHAFRLARTPYLFLTCGRWPHYHQPSDTPDKLNYDKMHAVAEQTERILRDLATRELAGPWEGYDPTPTDLALMQRTLGPVLRGMGLELRSRGDIDRAAELLMGQFRL